MMKERMLRRRLAEVLPVEEEVDRILDIIRSHDEY